MINKKAAILSILDHVERSNPTQLADVAAYLDTLSADALLVIVQSTLQMFAGPHFHVQLSYSEPIDRARLAAQTVKPAVGVQ